MTGIMNAMIGLAALNKTDTQTVTVGTFTAAPLTSRGFERGVVGSITDGGTDLYDGALVDRISYYEDTGGQKQVYFLVAGSPAEVPNYGWSKMTINGVDFVRTAGTYDSDGTSTGWAWTTTADPFPADGTVLPVTFS
jgi:hypothetical protein